MQLLSSYYFGMIHLHGIQIYDADCTITLKKQIVAFDLSWSQVKKTAYWLRQLEH